MLVLPTVKNAYVSPSSIISSLQRALPWSSYKATVYRVYNGQLARITTQVVKMTVCLLQLSVSGS
jgi:hypothetical protein